MWDLLRPRIEPVSSALTGRFLPTEPLGSPLVSFIQWLMHWTDYNLVSGCTNEPDTVDSLRILRVFSCAFSLCITILACHLLWHFYLDVGSCFLDLGDYFLPKIRVVSAVFLLLRFSCLLLGPYRANIEWLVIPEGLFKMSSFILFHSIQEWWFSVLFLLAHWCVFCLI